MLFHLFSFSIEHEWKKKSYILFYEIWILGTFKFQSALGRMFCLFCFDKRFLTFYLLLLFFSIKRPFLNPKILKELHSFYLKKSAWGYMSKRHQFVKKIYIFNSVLFNVSEIFNLKTHTKCFKTRPFCQSVVF